MIVLFTIAAGAGCLLIASAAFDVPALHSLEERIAGTGTGESFRESALSDSNAGNQQSGTGSSYVESFDPDDPYLQAALNARKAQYEKEHEEGTEEESDADSTGAGDSIDPELERIAAYIPMDGTYDGDISHAGGDFRVMAPEEERPFTITFAGDILFAGDYATGIKAGTVGIMNCFDEGTTELMRSADVFMLNNEFEYTAGGTAIAGKKYTLRAQPGTVSWLKDMGVDIVSLANNHMFDFQDAGLQDTLDTLRGAGMPYVGAGENIEEASTTAYIHIITQPENSSAAGEDGSADGADGDGAGELTGGLSAGMKDAMTIAIVNATTIEQYDTPDTRGATDTESGVFRCFDPTLLYQRITEAKQNADAVIVYVHWGTESTQQLDYRQNELADGITKAGADLIVGDHPHVLQAIGAVNGKPVAYSLGNYFFTSSTKDTGLLQAEFDPEKKIMTGLRFVPCLQSNTAVQLLDGSEKARVLDEMRQYSSGTGVSIDDDGRVTWQE